MSPLITTKAGASAGAYGWSTASAGQVASFESIATFTGNGSSQAATFSSIPSTFQHLQIRAAVLTAGGSPTLIFNGDSTAANYSRMFIRVAGATQTTQGVTSNQLALFPNGTAGINPSTLIMNIYDYASTSKYKMVQWTEAYLSSGAPMTVFSQGLWLNTAAITSIGFGTLDYTVNNMIALYGMKGFV